MLISLKWLSAYVPLTLPLKELTDKLTLAGVKVEKVHAHGDDWDGVRVAHVVAIDRARELGLERLRGLLIRVV